MHQNWKRQPCCWRQNKHASKLDVVRCVLWALELQPNHSTNHQLRSSAMLAGLHKPTGSDSPFVKKLFWVLTLQCGCNLWPYPTFESRIIHSSDVIVRVLQFVAQTSIASEDECSDGEEVDAKKGEDGIWITWTRSEWHNSFNSDWYLETRRGCRYGGESAECAWELPEQNCPDCPYSTTRGTSHCSTGESSNGSRWSCRMVMWRDLLFFLYDNVWHFFNLIWFIWDNRDNYSPNKLHKSCCLPWVFRKEKAMKFDIYTPRIEICTPREATVRTRRRTRSCLKVLQKSGLSRSYKPGSFG